MSNSVTYLHLRPDDRLPDTSTPISSRMVVVVEAEVSPQWQVLVSDWIVKSGCLYMMAWGKDCSSWDDSVDMANIEAFDFCDIPEDKFIMTTWHEDDSLAEFFWYAKNNAFHSFVEIEHTVLLHISAESREHELLGAYAAA